MAFLLAAERKGRVEVFVKNTCMPDSKERPTSEDSQHGLFHPQLCANQLQLQHKQLSESLALVLLCDLDLQAWTKQKQKQKQKTQRVSREKK